MADISDLISQMNPKRNPEELINNKREKEANTEKSSDENFKMDYYAILGVKKDATSLEIKRAYQKKLKKLHPDKIEQTRENKLKYKLVREAGSTLINEQKRKAYDMENKMVKTNNDIFSQRESFNEFIKLQKSSMTTENKKLAKLNFERNILEMNKKHGYDLSEANKMSKEIHNRKIDDMILIREQEKDELEIEQDDMFNGQSFNQNKFNKIFEKKKKKNKNSNSKSTELEKYNKGITAFNDIDGDFNGVSLDDYDKLYSTDKFNDYNENFAGIESGLIQDTNNIKDNEEDDLSIDLDDNYDNNLEDDFTKVKIEDAMKNIMLERNTQDSKFENMTDVKFGSAIDDKFGISNQLGFMIGNSMFGHQQNKKDKLKEDTMKVYKELTMENLEK
jgi:curved DNA-binding protein CbpA